MQHAYWELRREMANLHLVTQVQAELLRQLRTAAAGKGKSLPAGNAACSHSSSCPLTLCSGCSLWAGSPTCTVPPWFFFSAVFFSPCDFSQPSCLCVYGHGVRFVLRGLYHSYVDLVRCSKAPQSHFSTVNYTRDLDFIFKTTLTHFYKLFFFL